MVKTMPRKKGKPWTEAEDKFLTAKYNDKWPVIKIVVALERTRFAIQARASFLGLSREKIEFSRNIWGNDKIKMPCDPDEVDDFLQHFS